MPLRFATLLFTVMLTAVGIGISTPVLPALFTEVGGTTDLGWHYGLYLATYAAMQFFASPVLGRLSDRWGRMPVLVASAAGALLDDLFLAVADTLPLLYAGRVVAGLTGAAMAVASAMLADMTPPADRARRFGQLSAAFGIGFIIGPVIGGVLGTWSTRWPFLAAAFLEAVNIVLLLVAFGRGAVARPPRDTAPGATALPAGHVRALWPLLGAYLLLCVIGEVGGTVWSWYGQDRFGWTTALLGASLAAFGACHALVQAVIVGPAVKRLGERRAFIAGALADAAAYVAIAQVTNGLYAFLLMPLFCLGGIAMPVLQAMLTDRAGEHDQGAFQGMLGAVTSLASIVGPAGVSVLYFATRAHDPGIVWLAGACCYVPCLLLLWRGLARVRAGT